MPDQSGVHEPAGRGLSEIDRQFCDRFVARLRRKVQAVLYSRGVLSKQGGPSDLIQSALKSYLVWIAKHPDSGGIDVERHWRLLATIAIRKCRKAYRSYKRRGSKERPLDAYAEWIRASPNPSHEEAVTAADYIEHFDEDDRRICELLEEGYSQKEIAGKLGCSEKNVYRHLTGIRQRLREFQEV